MQYKRNRHCSREQTIEYNNYGDKYLLRKTLTDVSIHTDVTSSEIT